METYDIHVNKHSDFESRIPRHLHYEGKKIETVFSDNEAIRICEGITNKPLVRRILVRHFKGKMLDHDILELHVYAMKVVRKYGSTAIERIMQLPPLNFMFDGAQKMFASFDLMRKNKLVPEVRLLSKDGKILLLKFQAKIFRDLELAIGTPGKGRIRNPEDKIVLHSNSSDEPIICIYRTGLGEFLGSDPSDMKSYTNILDDFSRDMRGSVAHYGLQLGFCSFCDKPLSDERSIQVGYGRWCAKNFGLPWGKVSLNPRERSSKFSSEATKYSFPKQTIMKVIPKSSDPPLKH